jgi:hypothetical protein
MTWMAHVALGKFSFLHLQFLSDALSVYLQELYLALRRNSNLKRSSIAYYVCTIST